MSYVKILTNLRRKIRCMLLQKMPRAQISPPNRFLTCRLGEPAPKARGVAPSHDGDEVVPY
jgi:hypothetical protein